MTCDEAETDSLARKVAAAREALAGLAPSGFFADRPGHAMLLATPETVGMTLSMAAHASRLTELLPLAAHSLRDLRAELARRLGEERVAQLRGSISSGAMPWFEAIDRDGRVVAAGEQPDAWKA